MIKHNGKVLAIAREDVWDEKSKGREVLTDRLSAEVGRACDRFFEQRKIRRKFKEFWKQIRVQD